MENTHHPGMTTNLSSALGSLRELSLQQDLAYSLTWLKRLYLDTFQSVVEMIAEEQSSMDTARKLGVLRDATFDDTIDRMLERMRNQPGIEVLMNAFEVFNRTYENAPRDYGDLRNNPLIWFCYESQSSVFSFFQERQPDQHIEAAIDQGILLPSHVEQARDLIDLATVYLISEDDAGVLILGDMVLTAARHLGNNEDIGYALSTWAAIHLQVENSPNIDLVLDRYKEARDIFKGIPGSENQLDSIRINIKRLSAKLNSEETQILGRRFNAQAAEALEIYNEEISAGRFEEAMEHLSSSAEIVEGSERVEMESLCGLILLRLNRLSEAYKRLNWCKNYLSETNAPAPQTGTFESFKSAIRYREGHPRESAKIASDALARLEHVCPLSSRMLLAINLSAAQLDFDPESAAITAEKYEPQASGEDKVYLLSNLSGAKFKMGDVDGAEHEAKKALNLPQEDIYADELRFDLNFRLVQCAALKKFDQEAVHRGLSAFDEAVSLMHAVDDGKARNLFHLQAELLDTQISEESDRRLALEVGFDYAEKLFTSIGRVEDDIYDQQRLLTSYFAKAETFGVFEKLFDLYKSEESWSALMNFAQRFKSRFLSEVYFSISENMCAKDLAKQMAGDLTSDSGLINSLKLASIAQDLSQDAWQEALDMVASNSAGVASDMLLRPISLEHGDPIQYLLSGSSSSRSQEYPKIIDFHFAARWLPVKTALLEMVPLNGDIGILALTPDERLTWVGQYSAPQSYGSELGDANSTPDRDARKKLISTVISSFNTLGSDLERVLPNDTETLIVCPSSWGWSVPFTAIINGTQSLLDKYKFVFCPSAAFFCLAAARVRPYSNNGFALIDPRRELQFATHEASMLTSQNGIDYSDFCQNILSPDELREAANDKFWIHISAHGHIDELRLGLGSGLSIYDKDEPGSDMALGIADILLDPFPGLSCGVGILSACHAAGMSRTAEEPVGVATAILVGGAKAVIAPLWEVDEFATIMFFRFFYSILAESNSRTLSEAVRDSQIALRSMQSRAVIDELEKIAGENQSETTQRYLKHIREVSEKTDFPYSDPYYWSAFVLMGSDINLPGN